ncbi:MAG: CsgG/HfaB family protein, partial [Thermoguttaceae bacterium]
AKAPARLTVAVLDFTASDPATPNLGSEVAAALTAVLSGESGITLVERQSLAQTLREHELNMTGLVSDEQAVKIGKLVGAKIMITGRAFRLGKDLFLTAKLIGTETSLIEGVMVKDASSADMGAMVVSLSEKVAQKVRQVGPKLVAGPEDVFDPLPALKKKLADHRKPVVAVIIREQHHAGPQPVVVWVRPIDPAVETEVKKLLTECGFTVQDVLENELTDFARGWTAKDVNSWPRGLEKVEMLVAGEAFSEFAARIGNIVSCSARAEINLVSRKDGKVVVADRVTTRAADLSENIAGKKALQNAGRAMGIRLLEHFAETLPPDKPLSHKEKSR